MNADADVELLGGARARRCARGKSLRNRAGSGYTTRAWDTRYNPGGETGPETTDHDQGARLSPRQGPLPLGTLYLLALPIHSDLLAPIGSDHFGLPPCLRTHGTNQGNVMVLQAAHHKFGIGIPRVDNLFTREQPPA